MQKRNKLIAILLSLLLTSSVLTACSNQNSVKNGQKGEDTPPVSDNNDQTAEAITFLTEQEGAEDNLKKEITVKDAATLILRAFMSDKAESNEPLLICSEQGWVDFEFGEDKQGQTMPLEMYLSMAFRAAGIQTYKKNLYEDAAGTDGNATFAAKRMNIIPQDNDANVILTWEEADRILSVIVSEKPTMELPEDLASVTVETTDILSQNLDWYYQQINLIPRHILDSFIADGWKFIVGDNAVQDSGETNPDAIGLSDTKTKTIFLSNPRSALHEVGHYVWTTLTTEQQNTFTAHYNEEKLPTTPLVGDYAVSSNTEFFADMFSLLTSTKEISIKNTLETTAPKSVDFVCRLIEP